MQIESTASPATVRRVAVTLKSIAIVQIILGVAFLFAPTGTAHLLGLAPAPGWANWLLGMTAARFLGYGFGMLLAARQPQVHRGWIQSMIAVQLTDWILTLVYLARGEVTLAQVSTAAFLPVIWIAVLWMNRTAWLRTRTA